MKEKIENFEREELELGHKFATEISITDTDEYGDIYTETQWVYNNGLRGYVDSFGIHFTGINTVWNLRSNNNFEVVFIVKSNNAICDWLHDDLKKWADNGFNNIKALIVKGVGSNFWHYITPKLEDYEISRAYANCEDCLREIILH